MRYRYRCSREKCKARRALRMKLHEYVRVPKCKVCGSPLRLDRWEQKAHKKDKCRCDGYHFPHRKGSKFCHHFRGELTEQDMMERHYDTRRYA